METNEVTAPRELLDLTDRLPPRDEFDDGDHATWSPRPTPLSSIPPIARESAAAFLQVVARPKTLPPPIPERALRREARRPESNDIDVDVSSDAASQDDNDQHADAEGWSVAEAEAPERAALVPPLCAPITLPPSPPSTPEAITSSVSEDPSLDDSAMSLRTPSVLARLARMNRAKLYAGGAAAAVTLLLGYLVLHGGSRAAPTNKPTTPELTRNAMSAPPVSKPPRIERPAPAAPVVAVPAIARPSRPLVAVPITTVPDGATVALVDNGHATVLGTTPLTASIDPTRSYDLVLALEDHPTRLEQLAPKTTHALTFDLDPAPPAPTKRRQHSHTSRTAPARAKPAKVAARK